MCENILVATGNKYGAVPFQVFPCSCVSKKLLYNAFMELIEKPKKEISPELRLRHRAFIQAYTTIGLSTFGNGTRAYLVAFPDVQESTANVKACQLMKRDYIKQAVASALDCQGFNDITVDGELLSVIKQDKELAPKVQAIKEYNKLRERVREKGSTINIGFSLGSLFEAAKNQQNVKEQREVIDINLAEVQ